MQCSLPSPPPGTCRAAAELGETEQGGSCTVGARGQKKREGRPSLASWTPPGRFGSGGEGGGRSERKSRRESYMGQDKRARRLLFDEFFLTNFLLGPGNLPKINLQDRKIVLNPANCRKIFSTNFRLPNLSVPAICRIFLPDKGIDRGHSALFKIVDQHFQEGQGAKGKSSPRMNPTTSSNSAQFPCHPD